MVKVVIVGHGPSVRNNALGAVIDRHTVVRLKRGLLETHDRNSWGSRTDYLYAHSPRFDHGKFPFLLGEESEAWRMFWKDYSNRKCSTGTRAVMHIAEKFLPEEILLIGFDYVISQPRVNYSWAHDGYAERRALRTLDIPILDLAEGKYLG